MSDLTGKKIAIVATNFFEESELTEPLSILCEMGATADVAAPDMGKIQAVKGDVNKTITVEVDKKLDTLHPQDYDAVIIPGGVVNADKIRTEPKAQQFVSEMFAAGKLVAAICHGPWLLISAKNIVEGKTVTSYPSLHDDLVNAGAEWVDEEVVVDGNLITSRKPADIPAFAAAIAESLD